MVATGLRAARALIALVLAISTSFALIGGDMHVELQGYCDSADDYLLYVGASSMEFNSSAGSPSLAGGGLAALITVEGDPIVPCLVAMIDDAYSGCEHDGVARSVDRPG